MKVREWGRGVGAVALLATGVDGDRPARFSACG